MTGECNEKPTEHNRHELRSNAEVAYRKYKKSFEEHLKALLEGRDDVNLYAQESAKRHAEMLNELEKLFYGG